MSVLQRLHNAELPTASYKRVCKAQKTLTMNTDTYRCLNMHPLSSTSTDWDEIDDDTAEEVSQWLKINFALLKLS